MSEINPGWNFGRLFQVKKDVHDLQNSLENIIEYGYTREEVEELLKSVDSPKDLRELADHPLVKIASNIKTNLPGLAPFLKAAKISLPKAIEDIIESQKKMNDLSNLTDFNKITRDPTENTSYPPELPKIGDESLLVVIFTHKSAAENPTFSVNESNERLQFLGESVLSEITSKLIFKRFKKLSKEKSIALRNKVLSIDRLIAWAKEYSLNQYSIDDLRLTGAANEDNSVYGQLFLAYVGGLYVDEDYTLTKVGPWFEELCTHYLDTVDISKIEVTPPPQPPKIQQPIVQPLPQQYQQPVRPQSNGSTTSSYDPREGLQYSQSMGQPYSAAGFSPTPNPAAYPLQYPQPSSGYTPQPTAVPVYNTNSGLSGASRSLPDINSNEVRFAKETLYRKVCVAFVPEYIPLTRSTAPGAPNFRCACSINGEVIAVGSGDTLKSAGSIAAFNALSFYPHLLDRYAKLAIDIKAKKAVKPPKVQTDVSQQASAFQDLYHGGRF